jgi:hypothetical protein
MINDGYEKSRYEKYRGVRALEFLRVSTEEQKKNFGWPRQHQTNKERLIDPLELRVIGQIKDSYTGLDFQMHEALDEALRRAKNGEYDILIMDMLDRLGRKGLEREIYLLELKQAGVRAVSADPEDHSDDDSSWGEIIRYLKGKAAEDEVKNMRYRTMGGRRAKAMGDPEKGIEPQIVGNGHRYYGYKYVTDERGKRVGVTLNHDVIKVDEDGTEWTEVKVIVLVFESAAKGISLRRMCDFLNSKGIPSPFIAKGIKNKKMKYPVWHVPALSRFLKQSAYWGEARFNKHPVAEKVPGKRYKARRNTSEEEQLVVPVPAIVTKELAEQAQKRAKQNQSQSSRNNRKPQETILRAGFIKCGYCKRTMLAVRYYTKNKNEEEIVHMHYVCKTSTHIANACKGCCIAASIADKLAWDKVVELINDPREVDERVEKERKKDPTAERRKELNAKLKGIRDEQAALQDYLSERIRKRTLDDKTEARLNRDLHQLAEQEEECERSLATNMNEHERWKKIQQKLDELHQECISMRELLSDPTYNPPYDKKRELLTFFGIVAIIHKKNEKDDKKRITIQSNPPNIVSLLS